MTAALPEAVRTAGTPVEVWFQDEARVGQQGTLTYVWAEKGSRPPALKDLRYEWACQSAFKKGSSAASVQIIVMLHGSGVP